ncbi:hypothetical protein KAR91_16525 [Candidatus Pacearchaeota archaeon]|nr:hypothetical protein [Candidatus Pacearchaeota archaeon]
MKILEFQDLVQATLNDICPDLKIDVRCDRSRPWIQCCMGYIAYSFPINQKNFKVEKLKEELLKTLRETKDMIEQSIKEIE